MDDPAPTTEPNPAPNSPPPEEPLTLESLKKGLQDLAMLGKNAYDELVARIEKLEASPPIPDVSRQPPGPLPPPHAGPDRVEKVTVVNP